MERKVLFLLLTLMALFSTGAVEMNTLPAFVGFKRVGLLCVVNGSRELNFRQLQNSTCTSALAVLQSKGWRDVSIVQPNDASLESANTLVIGIYANVQLNADKTFLINLSYKAYRFGSEDTAKVPNPSYSFLFRKDGGNMEPDLIKSLNLLLP